MTTMTKISEKQEAINDLKELLQPGDTVYCILRHVSASGMMRRISLVIIKDNQTRNIDYAASKVLGYKLSSDYSKEGIPVTGCGMDMGFHLVYLLSSSLFSGEDRAGYKLEYRWL